MNSPRTGSRSGTILIIVAGISALLASLALAFLARMRSDSEESQWLLREAQAHLMLSAACNYIMETSRLGWDQPPVTPGTPILAHTEAFGWVDVRDGTPGPKDQNGQPVRGTPALGSPARWFDPPTGANHPALRCEMYVQRRPPYALKPLVAPNAVKTTGANVGWPLPLRPDPQPLFAPDTNQADYILGDTKPDQARYVPSWFRIKRVTGATFLVTCASGDTHGYFDWPEVSGDSAAGMFNNDPQLFQQLQSQEVRLHYLVEWSANVASSDYQNIQNEGDWGGQTRDHYLQRPLNRAHESRSQGRVVNLVGTIKYVQRLKDVPLKW
jgi:hypothetical protein